MMTPLSSPPATGGFSLLETVFALGLLTVALTGLLAVLPLPFAIQSGVEHRAMAGLIAETLRATAFTVSDEDDETASYVALDATGSVTRDLTSAAFADGDRPAAFVAAIRARRHAEFPALAALQITVEWPGAAPTDARARLACHTLVPCSPIPAPPLH
ncbi:MAG: hypothetical protein LBK71_06635 [Verrucomicrobiales bacterium]|jgi:hypothetical protein|nr:hypothetical protein [Verrucomicrobiales bacterium]